MSKQDRINELLGITDSYQAPGRLMEILYDRPQREQLFRKFLEAFDYDVSYDWFADYYQEEHADRRKKKQDFTPQSLTKVLSELVATGDSDNGMRYDPCSGTGSITITQWHHDRMQHSPFDYRPSWYVYHCEELSDRAIPFLLFNLLIRGMNAVVVHCDVISRKAYGAFFIQNDTDNHLAFSSLNVLPYNEEMAKYLAVEWVEQRYTPLVESPPKMPDHILNPVPRGEVSDLTRLVYAMFGHEVTVN